jgi:hypothetical protein
LPRKAKPPAPETPSADGEPQQQAHRAGRVEPEVEREAAAVVAEVRAEQAGLERDRFRTWVAILIAGVSILGAVVAWRGALVANEAGIDDQVYIQQLAEQQQEIALLTSRVDEDVRQVGPYAEHVRAAQVLEAQAVAAQAKYPDLALKLRLDAKSELALAEERRRFITAGLTEITSDPNNPVKYDRDASLRDAEQRDSELQKLHPDVTIAVATKLHTKSQYLVALVTLFVASLFFLTLAQFAGTGPRRIFAGAGVLVAILSLFAWVAVEVFA